MITIFYTCLYLFLYQFSGVDMKYYIFLGISIIVVTKGLNGFKFVPLKYLKIFEMKYSFQNLLELFACIIFIGYYYINVGILMKVDSIITLPSLIIFSIFHALLQSVKKIIMYSVIVVLFSMIIGLEIISIILEKNINFKYVEKYDIYEILSGFIDKYRFQAL